MRNYIIRTRMMLARRRRLRCWIVTWITFSANWMNKIRYNHIMFAFSLFVWKYLTFGNFARLTVHLTHTHTDLWTMRNKNRARHALSQLTAFAFRQSHRILIYTYLSAIIIMVSVWVCVGRSLLKLNGSVFSQLHIRIANTGSLFAEIIIYSIKLKYTI